MAVDTPARIAILGAGPIGLEAALYARFLGYDVDLYERGNVADNILRWGHVRMFSPFGMNRSTLGLAALQAQDESYRPPGDDEFLTGTGVRGSILAAAVADGSAGRPFEVGNRSGWRRPSGVVEGRRDRHAKIEPIPTFALLCRDSAGAEFVATAEVVIDTTGVFGNPNWAGEGGLPAIGEAALAGSNRVWRAGCLGFRTIAVCQSQDARDRCRILGGDDSRRPRQTGGRGTGHACHLARATDDRCRSDHADRRRSIARAGGGDDRSESARGRCVAERDRSSRERVWRRSSTTKPTGKFHVELSGEAEWT